MKMHVLVGVYLPLLYTDWNSLSFVTYKLHKRGIIEGNALFQNL